MQHHQISLMVYRVVKVDINLAEGIRMVCEIADVSLCRTHTLSWVNKWSDVNIYQKCFPFD